MILNSTSLSLLPAAKGGSASLLGVLSGPSTFAGNPITALQAALRNETKEVAAAAAVPQTKREVATFRAAVAAAKSPAELLANPVARKVLLTANGLGSQTEYAGLVSKALLSDTSQPGSLASKLTNKQFLATAKAFDFANQGLAVLRRPGVLDGIANGYAEVRWREGLDERTPGLSNAIDFRARAASIGSATEILGDKTLREVVTVALGIPKQIAFQSLEAQENAINRRVDITRFKDKAFVEQFTRRYLIAAGTAAAETAKTGSNTALGLRSGLVI